MGKSKLFLLCQVARKALDLNGSMGGKARISYACTCKASARRTLEGSESGSQQTRYVVLCFCMADQEQQHPGELMICCCR